MLPCAWPSLPQRARTGRIEVEGAACRPGELLWLGQGRSTLSLQAEAGARFLLLGGAPFEEDVLMWWNFVARTPEEMVRASADWNAGRHFGAVPGTALARLVAPDPARLHLRPSY